MNAEVMGDEVTVILTRDCHDHSPCVLNQTGFQAVSDGALVLRQQGIPAENAPATGPQPKPHGDRMLTRRVLLTLKDPSGEIVGLCGDWGLTSKPSVVQELLTGVCRYYMEAEGERLDVRGVAG